MASGEILLFWVTGGLFSNINAKGFCKIWDKQQLHQAQSYYLSIKLCDFLLAQKSKWTMRTKRYLVFRQRFSFVGLKVKCRVFNHCQSVSSVSRLDVFVCVFVTFRERQGALVPVVVSLMWQRVFVHWLRNSALVNISFGWNQLLPDSAGSLPISRWACASLWMWARRCAWARAQRDCTAALQPSPSSPPPTSQASDSTAVLQLQPRGCS